MAILADFPLSKFEDSTITVVMAPPVNIAGWTIRAQFDHRFGGISGLGANSGAVYPQAGGIYTASAASGFGGGGSGITITNSGAGQFNVSIPSSVTSGLDYGNYAYDVSRLDSGSRTVLAEGFLILLPSIGL